MAWVSENTARQLRALAEGSGLLGFWRWWSGELLAAAPSWLRALLRPARARLALQVDDHEVRLHDLADEKWVEIAHWSVADGGDRELPAEVLAAVAGRERLALLVLPRRDVLRRKVEVPIALAENLPEAIGFELDRYTPYKPEQVYFDTVVLSRDEGRGRLGIELGAVPRERAEGALVLASGLGFTPAGLLAELPMGGAGSLDFLPSSQRPRHRSSDQWTLLLPLLGVVLLGLIALVVPIAQKRAQVRHLEPLVNEARVRAEAAETLHRQLLAQQDEHNFLLARKHGQPIAIEVLDEATRILPDDTWVHLLELKSDVKNPAKNQELQVRGETGISGKLISVFEESRLFTQATYKSPVTKGQQGAGDMFHVAAEVKKKPLPGTGEASAAPTAPDAAFSKVNARSPASFTPAVPESAPTSAPVQTRSTVPVPVPLPKPALSVTPVAPLASPAAVPPSPGVMVPPPPRPTP